MVNFAAALVILILSGYLASKRLAKLEKLPTMGEPAEAQEVEQKSKEIKKVKTNDVIFLFLSQSFHGLDGPYFGDGNLLCTLHELSGHIIGFLGLNNSQF